MWGVWAVWVVAGVLWVLGTYAAIGFAINAGE